MSTTPAEPHLYWEDFTVGQVREFGRKQVTREEILDFARKYDPQAIHLSEEAAAASLFGRLSASGWHTCAMAMRMVCDNYLLDAASLGSPGIESLKWIKPVLVGDVLRMRTRVTDARPMNSRPHVGLVRMTWEVLNQHNNVAMEMDSWAMFRRRDVELD